MPHFRTPLNRREMLRQCCVGFGGLALADLLARTPALAAVDPLAAKAPHFPARAKRIIFLFMHGGPSHVDTFDYKPLLIRDHGKPLPFEKPRIQFAKTSNLRKSPWEFRPYGQSGTMVSDLFPKVGAMVDDLCLLKAVHGTNEAHGGALLKLHTGSDTFVRPSMGSWINYGLGTENQNLPGFITICPTNGHGGVNNWSSAFLPAVYQGTPLANSGTPAEKANINYIHNASFDAHWQRTGLDLVKEMNEEHRKKAGADSALEARIESFELAFRMQTEVPQIMDLKGETEATRKLYGLDNKTTENFGRQCLLARRFAEKGVRFMQVSHSYKWDQHEKLTADHARNAAEVDLPIAGLLTDLKARGLLEDTLVLWGGEFGRTPTLQGSDGRDHHPHAFTMWMAGGGVKPGFSYGLTDEYGFYTVDQKVHVHDLHATLLALLGLDHERLTYRFAGRDFRLTDVSGHVVKEIFA
jgi:hypothetical protein